MKSEYREIAGIGRAGRDPRSLASAREATDAPPCSQRSPAEARDGSDGDASEIQRAPPDIRGPLQRPIQSAPTNPASESTMNPREPDSVARMKVAVPICTSIMGASSVLKSAIDGSPADL